MSKALTLDPDAYGNGSEKKKPYRFKNTAEDRALALI